MTDEELKKRNGAPDRIVAWGWNGPMKHSGCYPHECHWMGADYAHYVRADRIEALTAENERLGKQCEGLMQAAMNNGQALILAEAKLTKAVEALRFYAPKTIDRITFVGGDDAGQRASAALAELEKE